jgi:hypothetical protein
MASLPRGRDEPELVLRIPLEGIPKVRIDAQSHEDEQRIRVWLRATSALGSLPAAVAALLKAGAA